MNKTELLQRKAELQKRLHDIHQDYQNGLAADSEERAQQLENADVLAEIERLTAQELEKVEVMLRQ